MVPDLREAMEGCFIFHFLLAAGSCIFSNRRSFTHCQAAKLNTNVVACLRVRSDGAVALTELLFGYSTDQVDKVKGFSEDENVTMHDKFSGYYFRRRIQVCFLRFRDQGFRRRAMRSPRCWAGVPTHHLGSFCNTLDLSQCNHTYHHDSPQRRR